tara:strand:- start:606 stop:884 length:279 start_codon:yes stop_codon:yes gene_type:complete
MTETQKFTEEELKEISQLREANVTKITEFGQLELELLLTNQRLEVLESTKIDIKNQYIALQEKEKELVTTFNEKYGTGTVDLASGEFVPKNS